MFSYLSQRMASHFFEVLLRLNWQVYSCSNCMFAILYQVTPWCVTIYPAHGVNCYTWHHLTFHSIKVLSVWIFLVCLLGLSAEGCSKTSANFLCCSYCTLVVMLIYVKIVTTLPGLPYIFDLQRSLVAPWCGVREPWVAENRLLVCRASERNFTRGTKTDTGPFSFWAVLH